MGLVLLLLTWGNLIGYKQFSSKRSFNEDDNRVEKKNWKIICILQYMSELNKNPIKQEPSKSYDQPHVLSSTGTRIVMREIILGLSI